MQTANCGCRRETVQLSTEGKDGQALAQPAWETFGRPAACAVGRALLPVNCEEFHCSGIVRKSYET